MGLLTTLDRVGFRWLLRELCALEQCIRFLQEHGNCYSGAKRPTERVAAGEMAKQACLSLRAFAAEFGLTPNSRLRLNVEGQEVEEDDPFERFLNGRR